MVREHDRGNGWKENSGRGDEKNGKYIKGTEERSDVQKQRDIECV